MRTLLTLIVALALAMSAAAEVPMTLSYQGVLRDDVGNTVPDDHYAVDVLIYDVPAGGAALWSEPLVVSTSDGVFDAVLGEVTPLHIDFDEQYWLTMSIEGEPELSPRVQLTAAAYALRAGAANSLRAGGSINVTGFRLTTGAASGRVLTSDANGNGSWQPATGGIGGGGTVGYIPKFTGAAMLGDSPIQLNGTMVGIGTSPAATLHVNGTMDVEDEATFHSDLHATSVQSSGDLLLKAGDKTAYLKNDTGNLGIGTASPSSKLTVSSAEYDDHILLERPGDQSGHITIGGAHMIMNMGSGSPLAIGADGDVGIGTSSPAAKLDVEGTAEVTGLRMATGAADGLVLVSDASGNASWQAAAADDDWQTFGSDIYRTTGDVGIGTSSPQADLDVNGTIATDGFRMPTGAGEGMALLCDNNGDAMWEYPRATIVHDYYYGTLGFIPSDVGQIADVEVSITVPRAGYVVLTTQVQLGLNHTSGTRDEVRLGHSDSTTDFGPWGERTLYTIPQGWPTEPSLYVSTSVVSTSEVPSAGTYTYYLVGDMYDGYDVGDKVLAAVTNAIFYPCSISKAE